MTTSIWTRYADRRPTREDADGGGLVVYRWPDLTDEQIGVFRWDRDCWSRTPTDWCCRADLDRATGYVKPRKLNSAWRELRADSWEDQAVGIWVYGRNGCVSMAHNASTAALLADGWTHWQPCDPPAVWEDET